MPQSNNHSLNSSPYFDEYVKKDYHVIPFSQSGKYHHDWLKPYYDDYDPAKTYQKIQFLPSVSSKSRSIGGLWGYEITRTLEPVKNDPETVEKLQGFFSKWYKEQTDKLLLNSIYGTMTSNVEDKKMTYDGLPDTKTILKRLLASKECTVKESQSHITFDGMGNGLCEVKATLLYTGNKEEIWRDEVCTERRIADLERDNERLRKERADLRQKVVENDQKKKETVSLDKYNFDIKLLYDDTIRLQNYLNEVRIERDRYDRQVMTACKMLYERSKVIDALYKKQEELLQTLKKNGLYSEPKNQNLLAYPGRHADWRKIVEVGENGDNQ
jgi:hypothetical protein